MTWTGGAGFAGTGWRVGTIAITAATMEACGLIAPDPSTCITATCTVARSIAFVDGSSAPGHPRQRSSGVPPRTRPTGRRGGASHEGYVLHRAACDARGHPYMG